MARFLVVVSSSMPDTILADDPTGASAQRRSVVAPSLGIRTCAHLLIVAVALPLAALLLYSTWQGVQRERAQAVNSIAWLARITAGEVDRFVDDLRGELEQVARRRDAVTLDERACAQILADLRHIRPQIGDLLVAGTDGRIACADPSPGVAAVRRASAAGAAPRLRFEPLESDARTGAWVIPFSMTITGSDGRTVATLSASIRAERVHIPAIAQTDLPAGSHIDIADAEGRVLASTDADRLGRPLDHALPSEALTARDAARPPIVATGERIVAYAPIASAGWSAVVATPAPWPDAARSSTLRLALAMLACTLCVVVVAAFALRIVLRPIHSIARVARAVAAGDLHARAQVGGPREVADIGAQINRMLDRRLRDEAALQRSEARFRELADATPAMIWMADRDGSCTYVNAAWVAFTGRSLDAQRGDGWLASVHPDDRDRCLTANAQALERREPFAVEFRLQRHDGEYRFVLDHGAPRIAADGSLAGFAGTCLDIHDRAVAEQRVRRLSMLYAALSHANEAIARTRDRAAMLRRICEIVVADGGFCTAWIGMVDSGQRGVRTAAYAGMAFEFFDRIALPLDAAHAIVAPPVRVIRDGRPYISNDRDADTSVIRLPAGAGTFVRSSAVVPIVQSGAVVGALAVHAGEVNYFDDELTKLLLLLAEDLSFALERISAEDRREHAEIALRQVNATLEERIAERTRSLEQANRELEAFSYSVSHDLRAPLRAIAGFTDLAIESAAGRLDEESRRYLDRVRAASRRMSTLINDLLDLSRIARSELTRGAVDLSSLAEEIVGELRSEDPARTVHVTIEPGVVANADRGLVRILLANLLGNAWKFTSRRPDATIEFGAVSEHGIRRFFVRDNGAGFDMAHAHKLFTPFQRLHSEREFSGTGIGLAIVRRIAERHGGDAVARSSEGAGTTIVFTLERASSHGD